MQRDMSGTATFFRVRYERVCCPPLQLAVPVLLLVLLLLLLLLPLLLQVIATERSPMSSNIDCQLFGDIQSVLRKSVRAFVCGRQHQSYEEKRDQNRSR
jgi:hypothetical protein